MTQLLAGLTFLRARYYASYLSQFIQPDSIVQDREIRRISTAIPSSETILSSNTDPSGHPTGYGQTASIEDFADSAAALWYEAAGLNPRRNPGPERKAEIAAIIALQVAPVVMAPKPGATPRQE
jgi:hypothetical protein